MNSKPPTKKAVIVAIRHVSGKPGSRFADLDDLLLAHRDATNFQDRLISLHGYHPENIVLMIDDDKHPEHLWPTRKRILTQIEKLTKDAPENCHITFYFSGHCLQEECPERANIREDGRDSEIVCADGKPILDYKLHKCLVEPLERVKGSKLFTLFDCCHSETLLDLQRGKWPNIYSRAWIIGPGQLFKDVATVIVNLLRLSKKCSQKRGSIPVLIRRASTQMLSPLTSSTIEVGELSVVCLCACRDRQLALDDQEQGDTFTMCFIEATSKPNVTWERLRDELKEHISGIRVRYEEVTHQHWTQDPRLLTSPWMDLNQTVSL